MRSGRAEASPAPQPRPAALPSRARSQRAVSTSKKKLVNSSIALVSQGGGSDGLWQGLRKAVTPHSRPFSPRASLAHRAVNTLFCDPSVIY